MTLILLSCFGGYSQNSSSTGGLDSLTISIADVRIINTKLLDYEYTKQKLDLYIRLNDSHKEIIENLTKDNNDLKKYYKKEKIKSKRYFGTSCGLGVIIIILIIL